MSGAFAIVDGTLQRKVELMFADSCDCHTVVRENPRQRERCCCNEGLHLVALCVLFFLGGGSLKCHLWLDHQQLDQETFCSTKLWVALRTTIIDSIDIKKIT